MAFNKVGMLKIAKVEIVRDLSNWDLIKKQARVAEITEQTTKEAVDKEALEKEADFQVIATINTEKFIYIHTTIMAGIKTAENGYWITPETEKYINDNHDAWHCEDLLHDYKSFKRATTFVEHDQRLENAKGRCIDVIARDMGDTLLIDVLFSVDKRHKDLVANIENGIINAVSMGCSTARTVCSICGNVSSDPASYCSHLKQGNKGRQVRCSDGKNRHAAEICKGNTFFDVSLVANPAFAGAVFRKILSSSEVSNHLLANILNSKIEAMNQEDGVMLKAASKETDVANISIKHDGTIEIKTSNQTYTSSETLSKDEIEKISSFIAIPLPPKETSKINMLLEKIFGSHKKEAIHPILNQSPKKDFSISYDNYQDIPYRNPHDVLHGQPILELNINPKPGVYILQLIPTSKENISRVEEFECLKCGFKSDLWKVIAASIDAGQENIIECPRCFYATDSSFFKTSAKRKFKKGEEVKVKGKGNGKIIALMGPLFLVKLENGKTVRKTEKDIEKIVEKPKKSFIVNQDIHTELDEGTHWFDQQGNSVITKGEKVSFVTTVGEYGMFVTEKGEDFFMPMSFVNSKKS